MPARDCAWQRQAAGEPDQIPGTPFNNSHPMTATLAQMNFLDLDGPAVTRTTMAATPSTSKHRERDPAAVSDPSKGKTGDLPTMIVDGIKNSTRYEP